MSASPRFHPVLKHFAPIVLLALVSILAAGASALAAGRTSVRDLEMASLGSGGALADGSSFHIAASAEGRYVVFESTAIDWTGDSPDDQNWANIFLRDRQADTTIKLTYDYQGERADESSYAPSISADGRYVVYFSFASDLVPNDTNGHEWSRDGLDVFLYDAATGQNQRVSLTADWKQIDSNSVGSISSDGNYILFVTRGRVLADGPTGAALYLRDWRSGYVERLTFAQDGGFPNASPEDATMSQDNQWIAFSSEASNIVDGDANGEMDVFLFNRATKTTRLVSRGLLGQPANGRSAKPMISLDGKTITFFSYASNLVPGDTNDVGDVFVYDVATDTLKLISKSESGEQGNGLSREPSICQNGRFISYTTEASNLVPGDTNGERDVILYDRLTGTNTLATVNGQGEIGNGRAHRSHLVPNCHEVSFASDASNLVAGDTNEKRDLFIGKINLPADFSRSTAQATGTARPGDTITYHFTLKNLGYETGVASVTSPLAPGVSFVDGSATNGAVFNADKQQVEWSGSLGDSGVAAFSFQAVVDPSLTEPTAISSQSTLSGDGDVYWLPTLTIVNGLRSYLGQVYKN